jgi:hypothetical protein
MPISIHPLRECRGPEPLYTLCVHTTMSALYCSSTKPTPLSLLFSGILGTMVSLPDDTLFIKKANHTF